MSRAATLAPTLRPQGSAPCLGPWRLPPAWWSQCWTRMQSSRPAPRMCLPTCKASGAPGGTGWCPDTLARVGCMHCPATLSRTAQPDPPARRLPRRCRSLRLGGRCACQRGAGHAVHRQRSGGHALPRQLHEGPCSGVSRCRRGGVPSTAARADACVRRRCCSGSAGLCAAGAVARQARCARWQPARHVAPEAPPRARRPVPAGSSWCWPTRGTPPTSPMMPAMP